MSSFINFCVTGLLCASVIGVGLMPIKSHAQGIATAADVQDLAQSRISELQEAREMARAMVRDLEASAETSAETGADTSTETIAAARAEVAQLTLRIGMLRRGSMRAETMTPAQRDRLSLFLSTFNSPARSEVPGG